MSGATTIAEHWDQRVAEEAITTRTASARVQARRDYYAGAMAALALIQQGRTPEVLLAEVRAYGRTIGTAAEAA